MCGPFNFSVFAFKTWRKLYRRICFQLQRVGCHFVDCTYPYIGFTCNLVHGIALPHTETVELSAAALANYLCHKILCSYRNVYNICRTRPLVRNRSLYRCRTRIPTRCSVVGRAAQMFHSCMLTIHKVYAPYFEVQVQQAQTVHVCA
jgi:hypothetical protein